MGGGYHESLNQRIDFLLVSWNVLNASVRSWVSFGKKEHDIPTLAGREAGEHVETHEGKISESVGNFSTLTSLRRVDTAMQRIISSFSGSNGPINPDITQ